MHSVRLGALVAVAALAVACDSARDISTEGPGQCTACHGYPPPPFVTTGATTHPASTNCNLCHAGTVEADNVTLVPGGLHLDGTVQGAGHEPGYAAPTVHGPDAIAFLSGAAGASACTDCHGADFSGGIGPSCNACHASNGVANWQANCTFCHGTPTEPYAPIANPVLAAPPEGVAGETDSTSPHVGAHQRHLQGGAYSDPFVCATCHAVPADLSHITGSVVVAPAGAGQRQLPTNLGTYIPTGQTCAVYCHSQNGGSNATPAWTLGAAVACNACHGLPPPSTNPAVDGWHTGIAAHAAEPCSSCHLGYDANASVDLALHVDGKKDVVYPHATTGQPTPYLLGWGNCVVCHTENANHPGVPNP